MGSGQISKIEKNMSAKNAPCDDTSEQGWHRLLRTLHLEANLTYGHCHTRIRIFKCRRQRFERRYVCVMVFRVSSRPHALLAGVPPYVWPSSGASIRTA